jgi:lipoate synthase
VVFDALAAVARIMGFVWVAAAPLVRSSYHADESAREALAARRAA